MAMHVSTSKLGMSSKRLRHHAQSPRYTLFGWCTRIISARMSEAKSRKGCGPVMTIRAIILGSALLFSLPLLAQENNDVLVMKNGDRFTCEIKGLSAGVLSVKLTYVDGTISVQWSQVAHLESNRLFLVKTESGKVYTGKLSTTGVSDDPPMKIEIAEAPGRE